MTVEIEAIFENEYATSVKMSRISTSRLPFQPRSINTESTTSSGSSDDYHSKGTRESPNDKRHWRVSSTQSGETRNEYDMIADAGPMPSSSVGEPRIERLHCQSASAATSRPAFGRANSAPEHVLGQSMVSTSSTTTGDEEVIIEEKRRRMKGQEGYTIHKYRRGKLLGKGGFAKVYQCTALDTGKDYAVKIVPKANLVKTRARQKVSNASANMFLSLFINRLLTSPLLLTMAAPS